MRAWTPVVFPAEQVTWVKARNFVEKLSALPAEQQAGRGYRLPTEAEWEYACRAGTQTAFYSGDSLSSAEANFNGNYPFGGAAKGPFLSRTTEVGSFQPNAFGLYDMHGNVWEWCQDRYGLRYYAESVEDDPTGPDQGSRRIIRGGDWYSDGKRLSQCFPIRRPSRRDILRDGDSCGNGSSWGSQSGEAVNGSRGSG